MVEIQWWCYCYSQCHFFPSLYRNQLQFLWMPFLLAMLSHRKQQHTTPTSKHFHSLIYSWKESFFTRSSIYFFILQPCCTRVCLAGYIEFHFFTFLMKNFISMLNEASFMKKVDFSCVALNRWIGNFYGGALVKKYLKCVNREESTWEPRFYSLLRI